MKARAAVLFEPKQKLSIELVDVSDPRAGEVLVHMAAGGFCHSDLHVIKGDLKAPLPAVLGHEGAGVVEAVGPGIKDVQPGDHVVPLWRLSCGECEWCTGGRPALCDAGIEIRRTGTLPGGGTGFLLNSAIFQRDLPLLQGTILVLAMFFVVLNLLVDVVQSTLDPRIAR